MAPTLIYWILAVLLAAVYVMAGVSKIITPKDKYVAGGMGWAENVPPRQIKLLGVIELAGALGMIVPPLTGIATFLAPLAAAGLAIVQIGAVIVHYRRGETAMLGKLNVPLIIAAIVASLLGFIIWV